MSKIYEALVNAGGHQRDARHEVQPTPPGFAERRVLVPAIVSHVDVDMGEEMLRLHRQLNALNPEVTYRAIQFIGSRESEGTSTVVREFGRVSATRFGQRVLILEMDRGEHVRGARGVGADGVPTAVMSSMPGDATLHIAPLPREFLSACHTADSPDPMPVWERLRTRYDLLLIDSLPAQASPEGFAVCTQVDGVVLVIEAEKTRWPVAEHVKQAIERSGGRVLGIVLNKRRYYIPQFIYRRL
jgi:hypothetical protein